MVCGVDVGGGDISRKMSLPGFAELALAAICRSLSGGALLCRYFCICHSLSFSRARFLARPYLSVCEL